MSAHETGAPAEPTRPFPCRRFTSEELAEIDRALDEIFSDPNFKSGPNYDQLADLYDDLDVDPDADAHCDPEFEPPAEPGDVAEDPGEQPRKKARWRIPGVRDSDDLLAIRESESDQWLAHLLADDDVTAPLSPLQAAKRAAAVRRQGDRMLITAAWEFIQAEIPATREFLEAAGEVDPCLVQPVAGPGTPWVWIGMDQLFGSAIGLPVRAAGTWLSAAGELGYHLPGTWAGVVSGRLDVAKAMTLSKFTGGLSPAALEHVDSVAAQGLNTLSFRRIKGLASVACAMFDATPDGEDVPFENTSGDPIETIHGFGTGRSQMTITAATDDLARFDQSLTDVANQLAALGDTSDIHTRRSKAIGILASPQQCLDLFALEPEKVAAAGAALGYTPGTLDPRLATQPGALPVMQLVVHLHGSALTGDLQAVSDNSVARVHRLGPQATDTIRRWVGHHKVIVTPVLDIQAIPGVDRYEIPASLRRAVLYTHPTCVFPDCGAEANLDIDHIEPFDHHRVSSSGSPPGADPPLPPQTRFDNLAPLCRRHHRLKTHAGWRYERPANAIPNTFVWTSPHGDHYLVDPTGTQPITTSLAHALTS